MGGSQYTECASASRGSCRDLQVQSPHCDDQCVAGCQCPGEQLMNDEGVCTAVSHCTCYDPYHQEKPIKNAGQTAVIGCANW